MKCAIHAVKFSCLVMLFGLVFSCDKNDLPPEEPIDPNGNAKNADTISNHIMLDNAIKKQGSIPQGPAGSSLKISFKDTLYLVDEYKLPIKFLHEDISENVAGIYVQVHGMAIGGTHATYFYDVPELQETADNDTVSTIMIGFDPEGLIGVPPAGSPDLTFTISITPYDPAGLPIATDSVPVKVAKPEVNPFGDFGSCSIITAPGDYWDWESSRIQDLNNPGEYLFYNSTEKLWGLAGQNIKGSCCNGHSVYGYCLGDSIPNAELHFPTFFNYNEEIFKFIGGGEYVRLTGTFHVVPDPQASDFCAGGEGVVREEYENITYYGNWTINKLPVPIDGDSLTLTLQGTSSVPSAGGYGNPGGRIHVLNCYFMMLIQPDREVPGRDLIKIYNYRDVDSPHWFPFG
jgi:hypothetical protein